MSHQKGVEVKFNSRLKRSRHGVYYYRAIVPVHLRESMGCKEIKRSLHTKDPEQARIYAHYIALSIASGSQELATLLSLKQNCIPTTGSWRSLMSFFGRDLGWVIKRPDGLELHADPNNPKDLEAAEKLALQLFAQGSADSQVPQKGPESHGARISEIYPRWVERISQEIPKQKTLDEYLSKFQIFQKYVGDLAVCNLTPKQISDFVTALSTGKITGAGLSASTINKYITAINSFLQHAQREGGWPQDKAFPTASQRLRKPSRTKRNSYKRFELEELKLIFAPENLLGWKKMSGQDLRPHMLWLPLLSLFTGSRIEELCQLGVDDIYQDQDAVWVFDINEDEWRQLKTEAAIRKIPLHPVLIELGFLDYVDDLRTNFPEEKLLFPYLIANKYGKLSDAASKWFGRYLDKLDITDLQKVFHSFRSTANDTLKQAGVPEETRCQLVGHEYGSVNSRNYSNYHSPKWLLENVIPKLHYPSLNFTGLKYKAGEYVPIIRKCLALKESRARHLVSIKSK